MSRPGSPWTEMVQSSPVIGAALVSMTVLHRCLKSSGPVLEVFLVPHALDHPGRRRLKVVRLSELPLMFSTTSCPGSPWKEMVESSPVIGPALDVFHYVMSWITLDGNG